MVTPFFKAKTILHAVRRKIFAMQSGFFLPSVCVVSRPVVWNICFIECFGTGESFYIQMSIIKSRVSSYLFSMLCLELIGSFLMFA